MSRTASEREALIEQARELRDDERLTHRQIADRLGVAQPTICRWLNPEAAERSRQTSRAWKHDNPEAKAASDRAYLLSGSYSRCSGPLTRTSTTGQCAACRSTASRERRQWITTLWGQGLTYAQIAATLGMTRGALRSAVAQMRQAGWDLPPRRGGRPPRASKRVAA